MIPRSLLCLLAIWGAPTLAADTPAVSDAHPAAEWRSLLRQLDAENFTQRRDAARQLADSPSLERLDALREALADASPEAAAQLVQVLEAWFETGPDAVAFAADRALSELQWTATPDIASQCRDILVRHARLRHRRAVARLVALGAKVDWGVDYAAVLENYLVHQAFPDSEDAIRYLELTVQPRRHLMGARIIDEELGLVPGPVNLLPVDPENPDADDVAPINLAVAGRTGLAAARGLLEAAADPLYSLPQIPRHVFLTSAWKGTEADLELLQQLTGAWRVSVYVVRGCPMSREAVLRATSHLGDVRVEERGPSLGVSSRDSDSCRIDEVLPGGAAERAGLQPGDCVLQVDDTPISNFQSLIRKVGEQELGSSITVQLLRRGERLTVQARLGDWTDVNTEAGLWNGREAEQVAQSMRIQRGMQMMFPLR